MLDIDGRSERATEAEWDDLTDRLARVLHREMERLDPTEDADWESMDERRRDFYRFCIEALQLDPAFSEGICSTPAAGWSVRGDA
ncbi:MAG: hypothetical protein ACJ8H8_36430 [Geminicoccaceae bacterium]